MSKFEEQLKVKGLVLTKRLANELETIMKANCKSKTIRQSIRVESGIRKVKVGIDQAIVKSINGKDFSEAYVKGAKPHIIVPKHAKNLVFEGRNGLVVTKRVNHPGSPPHPFIEESVTELISRHPKNIKRKK